MKIERLRKEIGGCTITLGGAAYTFTPNEAGAHVGEVDNPDHAKFLLGIPRTYAPYDDEARELAKDAGPSVLPGQAAAKRSDKEIAAQMLAATQAATGQTSTDTDTDTDTDADTGEGDDTPTGEAVSADEAELEALSDEQLREVFEKEIGRKARSNMLSETMIAQIVAKRAGE